MKTDDEARRLAHDLTAVGEALGKRVVCIATDMDQPLGMAVGNALEVAEAIDTLRGDGPAALTELCLAFGAQMLVLGGAASDESDAMRQLGVSIASGAALEKFREWVSAQGGDPAVADDPARLPQASHSRQVLAASAGTVSHFDAARVGRAAMLLGAGRARLDATIDPGAGLVLAVRVGDEVSPGDVLCTMYAGSEELLDAGEERFRSAVTIGPGPVVRPPLFHQL